MLVLSRKPGESLTIGDEVRITVLSISGKQVRIGIEAPNDIAVHREEIYNKIASERVNGVNDQSEKESNVNPAD